MVSVIIPSYNSEKTIERCLDSLTDQTYRDNYELILVDSSNDGTPHIVMNDYKDQVSLIHLDQKTDPGTARNIGLDAAKGDLIAFIDSDCTAARDWLERITEAHDSSYRVVGGAVRNGNDRDDLVARAGYLAEFREFLPEMQRREVMHIPTCNISYKKGVFLQFGRFQGKYYPQEDLVYNYHLWKAGEKILLDPRIQIYHTHRSGLKDFLNHQNRIGTVTSRVLKELPLQGSFIAKRPLLAVILWPFLLAVKYAKTVSVFLRYQPDTIREQVSVLPLLLLGLMFWAFGFVRGACKEGSL
ncbi:MAG TPA: glycosyltransferase [Syntrophorhabdaceae bacterium]|nr:glycosyltransferase [Syntrophorhabdaceae bacterium]